MSRPARAAPARSAAAPRRPATRRAGSAVLLGALPAGGSWPLAGGGLRDSGTAGGSAGGRGLGGGLGGGQRRGLRLSPAASAGSPSGPQPWAQVAQLVEHATENRSVGGSIPPLGTILKHLPNKQIFGEFLCWSYAQRRR